MDFGDHLNWTLDHPSAHKFLGKFDGFALVFIFAYKSRHLVCEAKELRYKLLCNIGDPHYNINYWEQKEHYNINRLDKINTFPRTFSSFYKYAKHTSPYQVPLHSPTILLEIKKSVIRPQSKVDIKTSKLAIMPTSFVTNYMDMYDCLLWLS